MRVILMTGLILLAACNGPSRHFQGLPATRVAVNGSLFDIRIRGDLAEAVRVNPQYAPRFGPIRDRAGWAIMLVSNCQVDWVLGDQALATGRLDCTPAARRRTGAMVRQCRQIRRPAGPAAAYAEFRCGAG